MASFCANCGTSMGLLQRLTGNLCSACTRESKQARADASLGYDQALNALVASSASVSELTANLPALAQQAGLTALQQRTRNVAAFRQFVARALEDDILSLDEENRLMEISHAFGMTQQEFDAQIAADVPKLILARVNDGRLPEVSNAQILLKKGERCHFQAPASLLKEVTIREWRSGSSGYSFRIMKGVHYRIGSSRGRSVVIGTRLDVEDSGSLCVTSLRTVFVGQRRNVECMYTKLLNMNVYSDGIGFNVSNRKNATVIKMAPGYGDIVAGIVNAVAPEP
jgi:hypothetical protein